AGREGPADPAVRVPRVYTAKMTTGQYVGGGITGTVAGLGIGHMVQGRWSSIGWIFTVSEGVGFAWYLYNSNEWGNCLFSDDEADCSSYFTQMMIGLGVIVGFHIWEIVNVWASPKRKADGNFYVADHNDRLQFGLAPYWHDNRVRPVVAMEWNFTTP